MGFAGSAQIVAIPGHPPGAVPSQLTTRFPRPDAG